jgi:hypothetical protein
MATHYGRHDPQELASTSLLMLNSCANEGVKISESEKETILDHFFCTVPVLNIGFIPSKASSFFCLDAQICVV